MVPSGWTERPLRALIEDDSPGFWGRPPEEGASIGVVRTTNFTDGGQLNFEKVAYRHLPEKKLAAKRLERGDILLERSGGGPKKPVGRVVFFNGHERPFAYTNFLQRIRALTTAAIPEFLFRVLWNLHARGVTRNLQQATTGIRNLAYKDYLAWRVPVPPLAEQKKIAEILQSVDDAIAKTQAVIDQTEKVKKGLLQELLTRGMPGRHTRFKMTEIGEIPADWEVVPAGEHCSVVTKGTTPKPNEFVDPGVGVPYLKVYNIDRRGFIDFTVRPTYVRKDIHEGKLGRSILYPGDVVMNIVGPPIGKVALVPDDHSEWNANQAVAVFRTDAALDARFLFHCLRSEHLFSWARKRAKRTSTQLNLTLRICRDYPIPLPPIAEQRELCAAIGDVEAALSEGRLAMRGFANTKRGLMDDLLTGRVRVKV